MYRLVPLPMQLSKQQKIVGAVLVLAVAAFVTDRWIIGHEADDAVVEASAAASRQSAGPARRVAARPAMPQAAAAAETAYGDAASLATRLENLRMGAAAEGRPMNLDAVGDAFRPPTGLVGSRKTETTDELADAAKRFVEKHKLAAVIKRQSGRAVAIIEDKTASSGSLAVAVGQSLDGFTLVAVRDRVAVLRRGAQRVELKLQEHAIAGTITPTDKVAGVDINR